MNKQRINILTPMPFWHPGTLEFIAELKKRNYSVVALDIWSFQFFNENEEYEYLCPKFLKGLALKIYRKLFRKKIIKKYIKHNDIVDVQWCGHYYAPYMDCIKRQSNKIIATLFGSDFYRSSETERKIQKKIFETAKIITIGPNMSDDFLAVFPEFANKIKFSHFGSARLDIISELYNETNKQIFRDKYKIKKDKIVITVGYSANPLQQHFMFLDVLGKLPKEIKQKLFLLLPMTYANKKDYSEKLLAKLQDLKIEFIAFQNPNNEKKYWLTDKEIAEIRIISDITVNTQTTDALSSSIKEAFATGNILLVGDWLPYEIYENMNLFFVRSSENKLLENFTFILNNYNEFKQKCMGNIEPILNFATWKAVMPYFIENYKQINE